MAKVKPAPTRAKVWEISAYRVNDAYFLQKYFFNLRAISSLGHLCVAHLKMMQVV